MASHLAPSLAMLALGTVTVVEARDLTFTERASSSTPKSSSSSSADPYLTASICGGCVLQQTVTQKHVDLGSNFKVDIWSCDGLHAVVDTLPVGASSTVRGLASFIVVGLWEKDRKTKTLVGQFRVSLLDSLHRAAADPTGRADVSTWHRLLPHGGWVCVNVVIAMCKASLAAPSSLVPPPVFLSDFFPQDSPEFGQLYESPAVCVGRRRPDGSRILLPDPQRERVLETVSDVILNPYAEVQASRWDAAEGGPVRGRGTLTLGELLIT